MGKKSSETKWATSLFCALAATLFALALVPQFGCMGANTDVAIDEEPGDEQARADEKGTGGDQTTAKQPVASDKDDDPPPPTEPADKPGQVDPLDFQVTNKKFLAAGGTPQSEAAVQAGLLWLALHQAPNGAWSFSDFPSHGKCNCGGARGGVAQNDVAGTAMAIMCFVAHGENHRGSEQNHVYTKYVDRGVKFLLSKQTKEGDFGKESYPMYVMGMATMALCEDYHTSGNDPVLKEPCQRAVNFICRAQHKDGGWRYRPNMAGDMSITSWQLQALKSAQLAGLEIPRATLQKATNFLKQDAFPQGDGYHYQPVSKDERVSMVAAGMLSRQYLIGGDLTSGPITKGSERILAEPPPPAGKPNMYFHYYGTQVMFNIQGKPWEKWNALMREHLIATQDKGKTPGYAHQKGSWDAAGHKWCNKGGRMMMTCMAILTLEVYYRFTPVNREGLGIMDKIINEKGEKKK